MCVQLWVHPLGVKAAKRGRWRACMNFQGRFVNGGSYGTQEAAAWAYDAKAKELWVNPILNFLPDGSLNPDRFEHHTRRVLVPRKREEGAEDSGSEDGSGQEEEEEHEEIDSSSSSSSGADIGKRRGNPS